MVFNPSATYAEIVEAYRARIEHLYEIGIFKDRFFDKTLQSKTFDANDLTDLKEEN